MSLYLAVISPFTAIQYVTSGITLVAFVAALIVYAYRSRLKSQQDLIRITPAKERPQVIDAIADRFSVDTTGLNSNQKVEIVSQQLKIRAQREKMVFMFLLAIAVLGAFITIVFMLRPGTEVGDGSIVVPKPKILGSYDVCTGEKDGPCSGHLHLSCGTDLAGWGKIMCEKEYRAREVEIVRLKVWGGNKCGYGIYQVRCFNS